MKWLIPFLLITTYSCIPGAPGPFKFKVKEIATGSSEVEIDLTKEKATFETVTKFIFKDKCLRCHKTGRAKADVNLEVYDKVFDWSEYFFPIVTKGDPDASGVYTEVARGAMPPKNPLTDEEVEFIKRWIEEGAPEN